MKLDMSKVYDRVEWIFFVKIMEKMGFHEKWLSGSMSVLTLFLSLFW